MTTWDASESTSSREICIIEKGEGLETMSHRILLIRRSYCTRPHARNAGGIAIFTSKRPFHTALLALPNLPSIFAALPNERTSATSSATTIVPFHSLCASNPPQSPHRPMPVGRRSTSSGRLSSRLRRRRNWRRSIMFVPRCLAIETSIQRICSIRLGRLRLRNRGLC